MSGYGPGYACAECEAFLRPKRNGIYVLETMHDDELYRIPYKVWMADLWACECCGKEIILGYGQNPLSVKHEDSFEQFLELVQYEVGETREPT